MRAIIAATALIMGTTALSAAPIYSQTEMGSVLTDEEGMTLYIFDNDEPGTSNCYDDCAVNWPPYIAEEGATAEEPFSLVEREDGSMMWAHDGWPLYYWVNDAEPGDTTGDGVGGVWHVVTEDAGAM